MARQYFLTSFISRNLLIENSAINHLIYLFDEHTPRTFNASLERHFVAIRPILGSYAFQFGIWACGFRACLLNRLADTYHKSITEICLRYSIIEFHSFVLQDTAHTKKIILT